MGVTVQVFAANNSSYRGRKRAHRACNQCKKRRKRCLPPFENHERCAGCTKDGLPCSLVAMDLSPGNTSTSRGSPVGGARVEDEKFTTDKLSMSSDARDGQARFIGDLNPEAALLTATSSSPSSFSALAPDRNEIGVWVSQSQTAPRKRLKKCPADSTMQASADMEPTLGTRYDNFLTSLEAFSLPPPLSVEALLSLYLTSVHPIYPLVDAQTINLFKTPQAIPVLLLQSILLVASRHPNASEYLFLSSTSAPLSPRDFASTLYTRITALLHAGKEKDRIRLIRVYGLLSLHSADGPDGNEVASMNLCTAIHHAHSAGLHLKRRRRTPGEAELWWCLWGLDKLQAAINGRPVLVRGEDTDIDPPDENEGTDVFRGMVKLAGLLERVIALYRPRKSERSAGSGGDAEVSYLVEGGAGFPSFKQVVGDIECEDKGLLTTLTLFYHAISILSHRIPTSTPLSPSHIRRTTSAKAIYETLTPHPHLPPTPITPYAASLSLTTFYALVHDGEKAYAKPYKDTVRVLENLSRWWWFAGAMAALGREAVGRRGKVECAMALSSLKDAPVEVPRREPVMPQVPHVPGPEQLELRVPESVVGMAAVDVGIHDTGCGAGTGTDLGGMGWGCYPPDTDTFLEEWADFGYPTDYFDPMLADGDIVGAGINGVGLVMGLGLGMGLGMGLGRDECSVRIT